MSLCTPICVTQNSQIIPECIDTWIAKFRTEGPVHFPQDLVVWHWVIEEQFYIRSNWLRQSSCISKHRTPGHGHSPACDPSGPEAHPLYAPRRTPPCIAAAFAPTWPPSSERRLSPLLWRSRPHAATFPSIGRTPSLYGGTLHISCLRLRRHALSRPSPETTAPCQLWSSPSAYIKHNG